MNERNISSVALYYKLIFLKKFDSLDQKTREALGKSLGIGTNALKKYLDPLLNSEWITKDKITINGKNEARFFPLKEDPFQLFEGPHIELIKSLIKYMYSERDILGKADRLSPENIILLCLLLSRADTHGISDDLSSSELKGTLGVSDAQLKSQITKLRRLGAIKIAVPGRVFKNIIGRQSTIYQVNVKHFNEQFSERDARVDHHETMIFGEHPYANRIKYRLKGEQHEPLLGRGAPDAQTLAFQELVDFRLTQYASALVNDLINGPAGIQQVNTNEDSFEIDKQLIQGRIEKDFPRTIRQIEPTEKSMQSNKQSGNLKPVRNKTSADQTQPPDLNVFDKQILYLHKQLVELSIHLARICVHKLQKASNNIGVIKKAHMLPSNASLSGDYVIIFIAQRV